MKTENRFSPGPADQRNQAALRHPERSIYRCFLTDLAGFIDICRAGPDYADRQDRKKTGLFRLSLGTPLFYYFGGQMSIIFIGRIAIVPYSCRGTGHPCPSETAPPTAKGRRESAAFFLFWILISAIYILSLRRPRFLCPLSASACQSCGWPPCAGAARQAHSHRRLTVRDSSLGSSTKVRSAPASHKKGVRSMAESCWCRCLCRKPAFRSAEASRS